MSAYRAPLRDMRFVLELAGLDEIAALPGFEDASLDLAETILEEAARFAGEVLDPLNAVGDRMPPVWTDGAVRMSAGFVGAYRAFTQAGWAGLTAPTAYGGQGMPQLIGTLAEEMWNAGNMSFALAPMLMHGVMDALLLRGTPEQKERYVPKLVAGEWAGTMVLTEPQAGSDLSQVRTLAVRDGASYRLRGQKIFITFGEHDLTENIMHLVLARTPDAPAGVKGLSLFVVPKLRIDDAARGELNDVRCVSIEHKLGIHGSPTCVLSYGERDGAIGELIGEENQGLSSMFITMNIARFLIGVQALGCADRAYQHALAYARERVQSVPPGASDPAPAPIIRHPDVRRMLMSMKARIEAMRALAASVAAAMDRAHAAPDAVVRAQAQTYAELMTPVVKGWLSEESIDIASLAIQVHGGMGYIEETGVAQLYRDAKITTIYEGTTAIQANDLVGRKLLRDGGAGAAGTIHAMRAVDAELAGSADADVSAIRSILKEGIDGLEAASEFIRARAARDLPTAYAGSVPYLMLWGVVAGGWQMACAALLARRKLDEGSPDTEFLRAKIVTARFYAEHVLVRASGIAASIVDGAATVLALSDAGFAADR